MNSNDMYTPALKSEERDARLRKVEASIKGLAKVIAEKERLDDELNRLERAYVADERVVVQETCQCGCCVEREYSGVVGVEYNGSYAIKTDTGRIERWASPFNMIRVEAPEK